MYATIYPVYPSRRSVFVTLRVYVYVRANTSFTWCWLYHPTCLRDHLPHCHVYAGMGMSTTQYTYTGVLRRSHFIAVLRPIVTLGTGMSCYGISTFVS